MTLSSKKEEKLALAVRKIIPDATLSINDTRGDGSCFILKVKSASFQGKTRIQQHKMVYSALRKDLDSGDLHAISLQTSHL